MFYYDEIVMDRSCSFVVGMLAHEKWKFLGGRTLTNDGFQLQLHVFFARILKRSSLLRHPLVHTLLCFVCVRACLLAFVFLFLFCASFARSPDEHRSCACMCAAVGPQPIGVRDGVSDDGAADAQAGDA